MLNNRLAFVATWLAVLATAGLVPNTLATIFGIGRINDLIDWPWILTILIVSTIVCTYLIYLVFKRKQWMPPRNEC
jgi:Mg2+ and Co2+ transporter CorA